MILRGIFCAPSPAFFWILQPGLKEGALVGMMPIHGGRFLPKTLKNASFPTLQWLENDDLWEVQYEKNMGAFLKRTPQMKKICSHWKTICGCQIVQPCNGLQKIFYVWSWGQGVLTGGRSERRKGGGGGEKADVSLKIFQVWITEMPFTLRLFCEVLKWLIRLFKCSQKIYKHTMSDKAPQTNK